jgi:hypothetical protein
MFLGEPPAFGGRRAVRSSPRAIRFAHLRGRVRCHRSRARRHAHHRCASRRARGV